MNMRVFICWFAGHVWKPVGSSLSHPHIDGAKCSRCGAYKSSKRWGSP